MNKMKFMCWLIFILSIILLVSVSWKIAVGVLLFEWSMNINKIK